MRFIGMLATVGALAGCVVPETDTGTDGTPAMTGATPPRNTSAAALAALPAGMPPSLLIRDGNGCYGVAVEASEPVQGIPLRNGAGQQVCDG